MQFNINPYFDDFEQNAKDNNYLKILFKPGSSVQARELTQIQSILQNQIKSFGDHIFQDGSPVIGGNLTLDNKISYIKLNETYNNEDIEIDAFLNKIIVDDSGLIQAKVLATYYPSGGNPTLLVKYISGSQFTDSNEFRIIGTTIRAQLRSVDSTGLGTVVSINEGIFYVNGYFVTVNPQTTVVDAYGQNANVKIGLEISEDLVDYRIDSTLLDPAQGSFNYQAPGADRFQFNLNLSTRPIATSVDESSFFELMRVENGSITKQIKYPIYSEIEKTLARRTFDESGDYTVVPFIATVGPATDANNYIINIDPGKAYVKGFEFETISTFRMETEKPRTVGIDTRSLIDIDVDTSYGNYLVFKNLRGNSAINIGSRESVDLHCVSKDLISSTSGSANTLLYDSTKIGTARISNIQRDHYSYDPTDTNKDEGGTYRIYFSDISIQPKILALGGNTGSSSTINLTQSIHFNNTAANSTTANAYQNVSVTVLPIYLTHNEDTKLVVVANRNYADGNSSFAGSLDLRNNLSVGDVIRVGSDIRTVTNVGITRIYVNKPFSQNLKSVSGNANVDWYKVTSYTSNVTNQSRTIISYDSSTGLATLDRGFDEGAVAAQNTVVQLNFGVKDLESFIEIDANSPLANAWANVSVESKLLNGDTDLFDQSRKSLIFRLPKDYVRKGISTSITNVDYYYTKYIPNASGSAGSFTITLDSGESIFWAATNSNIEQNLIAILRSGDGSPVANGQVLKLLSSNVTITGSDTLNITGLDTGTTLIDVYLNVKFNNVDNNKYRTKTIVSNPNLSTDTYNYPEINGDTITLNNVGTVGKIDKSNGIVYISNPIVTNIEPGDPISLYVPDVIKIRKILVSSNAQQNVNSTNYIDATDNFYVNYGQTDNLYDHASIILKQGYPAPNSTMLIHMDYYEHDITKKTYFSVDSYANTSYENGEIPIYVSNKSGVYNLRDCLDFRPTRLIGQTDGSISSVYIPSPDSSTELSFDYYLPRIDKLVLGKNKEFRIIKGIASPNPVPPEDDSDSMTLYTIKLPPFSASTKDIILQYNQNRRYTMKDIASLDKRLSRVEIYTALNSVEQKAMNDQVQYEDGTNKEKWGIVGEGFKNYNISDYNNPDFSVDLSPYEMKPKVVNRVNAFEIFDSTDISENEKTITLSYTETPAISQSVTSNKTVSAQPFLFASYIGGVKLTPETDFWVSEELKPEVIRGPEITRVEIYTETIIEKETQIYNYYNTIIEPCKNSDYCVIEAPEEPLPEQEEEDVVPCQDDREITVLEPVELQPTVVEPTKEPIIDPVVYWCSDKEDYENRQENHTKDKNEGNQSWYDNWYNNTEFYDTIKL